MSQAVAFFVGWLGYGSSLQSLRLVEPSDPSYARRPILYGPLNGVDVVDESTGSIGPAGQPWVGLDYAGLFDAAMAGNQIAAIRLTRPVSISAGGTLTDSGRFGFTLAQMGNGYTATSSWVAGSTLGWTIDGSAVVACSNLQLSGGSLAVIGNPTSAMTLAGLPVVAPASGSGLLWNNGGVICIA